MPLARRLRAARGAAYARRMRLSTYRAGLLLVALIGAGACKNKTDLALRDTEGRAFSAHCAAGQSCTVKQTSGAPAPSGKPAVVLRSPGRLIGACTVAEGAEPETPAECRALTCTAVSYTHLTLPTILRV